MADLDMTGLLRLLRECVEASRLTYTAIEDACGIGHGRLRALLAGRIELRVRHLLGLARLLGVPPADFLELGCFTAQRTAKSRLAEYLGPARAGAQDAAPESATSLRELVRAIVREELATRG
jgi:transcriptional regulator with XRE-family HTH domain